MATPVPPESEGEAGAPLSDQHVQFPMPKSESDAEWDKMMVDAESAESQNEAFIHKKIVDAMVMVEAARSRP